MNKLIKIINEEINSSCYKYFDLNDKYKYVEFDKPLYSMVSKGRVGRLIDLNPKQYLYNIARNFGLSYEDTSGSNAVSREKVLKYAKDMRNGSKFPIPYYNENSSYQEGRHRALAAMKNGCSSIPIIVFSDVSNAHMIKWAELFKNKSFEEMNEIFIEMGFENGITKLGYNDLTRFIEYNL
ncbi:MAG: hypothetical protein PF487_03520 [Bacteroidales bacterium]|jgi:hypothetical protein|nr:hypothetical protein [Bacteroidales bacterium]